LGFFGIFTSATKHHIVRLGLGKERPMDKKSKRSCRNLVPQERSMELLRTNMRRKLFCPGYARLL